MNSRSIPSSYVSPRTYVTISHSANLSGGMLYGLKLKIFASLSPLSGRRQFRVTKGLTNFGHLQVQILFEDLILNKKVIKILYNVPDSIAALDATLEHIFRGRPPPPNKGAPNYQDALRQYKNSARKPFRETEGSPLRLPHYKDTGPETYLDVNRPASLEFERGEKPCPLGFHGPGVDYAGRRCPCYLGILDITSILDFILRQHHFIPGDPTSNLQEMGDNETMWPALGSWAEPRKDCNFTKLAQWMLAGSKYQPLFCMFKTRSHTIPKRPHITGIQGIGAKEAMNIYNMQVAICKEKYAQLYTAFGETNGIERDEVCLSYIVGDAIGLGLMFRYLLTTESPRLYVYLRHSIRTPPPPPTIARID